MTNSASNCSARGGVTTNLPNKHELAGKILDFVFSQAEARVLADATIVKTNRKVEDGAPEEAEEDHSSFAATTAQRTSSASTSRTTATTTALKDYSLESLAQLLYAFGIRFIKLAAGSSTAQTASSSHSRMTNYNSQQKNAKLEKVFVALLTELRQRKWEPRNSRDNGFNSSYRTIATFIGILADYYLPSSVLAASTSAAQFSQVVAWEGDHGGDSRSSATLSKNINRNNFNINHAANLTHFEEASKLFLFEIQKLLVARKDDLIKQGILFDVLPDTDRDHADTGTGVKQEQEQDEVGRRTSGAEQDSDSFVEHAELRGHQTRNTKTVTNFSSAFTALAGVINALSKFALAFSQPQAANEMSKATVLTILRQMQNLAFQRVVELVEKNCKYTSTTCLVSDTTTSSSSPQGGHNDLHPAAINQLRFQDVRTTTLSSAREKNHDLHPAAITQLRFQDVRTILAALSRQEITPGVAHSNFTHGNSSLKTPKWDTTTNRDAKNFLAFLVNSGFLKSVLEQLLGAGGSSSGSYQQPSLCLLSLTQRKHNKSLASSIASIACYTLAQNRITDKELLEQLSLTACTTSRDFVSMIFGFAVLNFDGYRPEKHLDKGLRPFLLDEKDDQLVSENAANGHGVGGSGQRRHHSKKLTKLQLRNFVCVAWSLCALEHYKLAEKVLRNSGLASEVNVDSLSCRSTAEDRHYGNFTRNTNTHDTLLQQLPDMEKTQLGYVRLCLRLFREQARNEQENLSCHDGGDGDGSVISTKGSAQQLEQGGVSRRSLPPSPAASSDPNFSSKKTTSTTDTALLTSKRHLPACNRLHKQLYQILKSEKQMPNVNTVVAEATLENSDDLLLIDLLLPDLNLAIEIDGRGGKHFLSDGKQDGMSLFKHRLIRKLGWKLLVLREEDFSVGFSSSSRGETSCNSGSSSALGAAGGGNVHHARHDPRPVLDFRSVLLKKIEAAVK
ncbi:unnamed protein product [Amoebophrya sp. A120]|nr:unnamed protein product [Amoebophrya sp. A120]|eukprot:GSA120T00013331001.1